MKWPNFVKFDHFGWILLILCWFGFFETLLLGSCRRYGILSYNGLVAYIVCLNRVVMGVALEWILGMGFCVVIV